MPRFIQILKVIRDVQQEIVHNFINGIIRTNHNKFMDTINTENMDIVTVEIIDINLF